MKDGEEDSGENKARVEEGKWQTCCCCQNQHRACRMARALAGKLLINWAAKKKAPRRKQ